MADDDVSRSSAGDDEFEEPDDNGEDYEATLDEEEALDNEDYANELKDLDDEAEMSIEELRRRYGLPSEDAPRDDGDMESGSQDASMDDDEDADGSALASAFLAAASNSDDGADADDGEEIEDGDYAPPDRWKKEVRVDESLYQAPIPALDPSAIPCEGTDALWRPVMEGVLDESALNEYLRQVVQLRREVGQFRNPLESETKDNEDALCALYRNNYDVEAAKAAYPFPHVNLPCRTVRSDALAWDDAEKVLFEEAMNRHGKNFHVIHGAALPYRRVGELVEYYYGWKKTDRYRNYRKRQLQPDTDYHAFTNSLMHPQHPQPPHHDDYSHQVQAELEQLRQPPVADGAV